MDDVISIEGEGNSPKKAVPIDYKDKFLLYGSFVQIFFAISDTLAGNFAMLYAVSRGSVGLMQGVLVSVRELGTAILQPIWGYMSDRRGRRYFVFTGLIFQAISWGILLPLTKTPLQILIVFIFQTSLGTMFIPTWNAWIGDRTVRHNRGTTLGYLGLISSIPSSMALFFVSLYMQSIDPTRQFSETFLVTFRIAGIFYFLSASLVLFLPETPKQWTKSKIFRKPTRDIGVFRLVYRRFKGIFFSYKPEFRRILLIEGLFRIAWSSAWPLFPYGILSATEGWIEIAIMELVITITLGISAFYGGKISDRIGRKAIIKWTRLALILPPLLFSLGIYYNEPLILIFSNIIVGLTLGAGSTAMNSLILDIAPEGKEGTYFSTYLTVMGILAFVGSISMGLLLAVIIPNKQPSDNILISLFILASSARLLTWIGYKFLPEL